MDEKEIKPSGLSTEERVGEALPPQAHHAHVGAVGLRGGDASVLHDPLVPAPLLAAVAAVVAEAPGAVDEHLLRQNLLLASLGEKTTFSHVTPRPEPTAGPSEPKTFSHVTPRPETAAASFEAKKFSVR